MDERKVLCCLGNSTRWPPGCCIDQANRDGFVIAVTSTGEFATPGGGLGGTACASMSSPRRNPRDRRDERNAQEKNNARRLIIRRLPSN